MNDTTASSCSFASAMAFEGAGRLERRQREQGGTVADQPISPVLPRSAQQKASSPRPRSGRDFAG